MHAATRYGWMVLLPMLLAGCVAVPTAQEIGVALNPADYLPTGKSLTVGEVVGKVDYEKYESISDGVAYLGSAPFREALVATLKSSGIFRDVSPAPGGDYTLTASVAQLDLKTDYEKIIFVNDTLTLIVSYALVDNASGKVVWSGAEYSRKTVGSREAWDGATRRRRLREQVYHDNLAKLAADLSEALAGPDGAIRR